MVYFLRSSRQPESMSRCLSTSLSLSYSPDSMSLSWIVSLSFSSLESAIGSVALVLERLAKANWPALESPASRHVTQWRRTCLRTPVFVSRHSHSPQAKCTRGREQLPPCVPRPRSGKSPTTLSQDTTTRSSSTAYSKSYRPPPSTRL